MTLTATATHDTKTASKSVTITVIGNPCSGIESCYLIRTLDELQNGQDDLDGLYFVMNDVDASATRAWGTTWIDGFVPIGSAEEPFTGTLNGQNHAITDLHINHTDCTNPDGCPVGLISVSSSSSTIENLNLEDADVSSVSVVGGLAGRNFGLIRNSSITGSVSREFFGSGLVGIKLGRIQSSYSERSVTGLEHVGGLVGNNQRGGNNTSIIDSHSNGPVNGGSHVGGLIGASHNQNASIKNSHSSGDVNGTRHVGGLIGNHREGSITDSHSTSNVEDEEDVGGLTGTNYDSSITNSHSEGDVTGEDDVGGVTSSNHAGTITDSHSSGTRYVGGLVGNTKAGHSTTRSYWDANTSGQASSEGGESKTTTEMRTGTAFPDWHPSTWIF